LIWLYHVLLVYLILCSNYTVRGKKYKLVLEHLSEDKHMYTSTLCFKTEQELSDYMNGNRDQRISALHDAKTVQNFLSAMVLN